MKTISFLECRIESDRDCERLTKYQVRPLFGWPGGVDPYPWAHDEMVVMEIVKGTTRRLSGASHCSFDVGESFEFDGSEWFVTSVTNHFSGGDRMICDVEAISRK